MLTPGRLIAAVPSNDTPPIALAVANAVAVAALPVQEPEEPDALPVTLPVNGPTKLVAVTIPAVIPPVGCIVAAVPTFTLATVIVGLPLNPAAVPDVF